MPANNVAQSVSDADQLKIVEDKLQESNDLIVQMRAAEYERTLIMRAKHLATQTRYQNAMHTASQTKGQIAILSEQLVAQENECHKLEGILEYLQSMPDQCNAE